jgi:hypothetical protein
MAVEYEFAAHHVRPASKLALPERVAERHTLHTASTVIVSGRDQTAYDRLYSQNMKEFSAHEKRIRITSLSALSNI